jgi:hypothetical protein
MVLAQSFVGSEELLNNMHSSRSCFSDLQTQQGLTVGAVSVSDFTAGEIVGLVADAGICKSMLKGDGDGTRERRIGEAHTLALRGKPLPVNSLLLLGFGRSTLIVGGRMGMEKVGAMMNNYMLVDISALDTWPEELLALLWVRRTCPSIDPKKYTNLSILFLATWRKTYISKSHKHRHGEIDEGFLAGGEGFEARYS